jgi:hypothetical protein
VPEFSDVISAGTSIVTVDLVAACAVATKPAERPVTTNTADEIVANVRNASFDLISFFLLCCKTSTGFVDPSISIQRVIDAALNSEV